METTIPTLSYIDETKLNASICKQSFYEFVLDFWETIEDRPLIDNWHIEYVCNEIQIVCERVFKGHIKIYDLVINITPGSSKSIMASVMLTPWVWANMPHLQLIGASYSSPLALNLSRRSRDVVLSDKYREYYPHVKLRKDQATKSHFVNILKGSRYSVGVGGSVTGMHGDIIVVDDPLNPEEAASEQEIKNANRWMSETLPSRKTDKRVVPIILIMQRLHQDDPTGHKLALRKDVPVKHICIPGELTKDVNPPELKEYYIDGLFDAIRFPREVLKEMEAELLPFGYACQVLQTPIPAGGGMFKMQNIQVFEWVDIRHFTKIVRFWDKAATPGDGCYTAGVKLGLDLRGRYWVLEVVRDQLGTDEREKLILETAERDGLDVEIGLEQEGGSGGKDSVLATVKMLAGYIVKPVVPSGSKEARAKPVSVQVNLGNMCMVKAPWNKAFTNEGQYFPGSKYKDQIDAFAGAFGMMLKPKRKAGALFHGKNKNR